MNLLHLSNLFNKLVQDSSFFQSYHFGYHSDININVPNNFDPNNEAGKRFPHVLWAAPVEGQIQMSGDNGTDDIDVMLFFYSLHGYRNDSDPIDIDITMLRQWNTLKARAIEFVHALNKGRDFKIKGQTVKYFTDSNVSVDRLLCVGVEFRLTNVYGCPDYEAQIPPLSAANISPVKSSDLEAEYVS
jgi:hypothetical protein